MKIFAVLLFAIGAFANAWADGVTCSQILVGAEAVSNIGVVLPKDAKGISRILRTRFDPDSATNAWVDCELNGVCTQRVSIGVNNEQRVFDREDKREIWVILVGQHHSLNSWFRYCVEYSGGPSASNPEDTSKFSKSNIPAVKDRITGLSSKSSAAKTLMKSLSESATHQ
jgi:hypothetical protein